MIATGTRNELSGHDLFGPAIRLALGIALCLVFLATVCGMALVV